MRRGTLTIQARYRLSGRGTADPGRLPDDRAGRIAWVGSANERAATWTWATWRSCPVSSMHTRTSSWRRWAGRTCRRRRRSLLAAAGGRPAAGRQREESARATVKRNVKAVDRGGHDASGRHHHGRALLGVDRGRASAGRRLCRVDRAEARPRARDERDARGAGSGRFGPRPRSPPAPGRA